MRVRPVAEDSAALTFGKVLLGGAVGFALLFVGTGLGWGRRGGASPSGGGGPFPPLPAPSSHSLRPKDDKRLSFVMIEPKVVGGALGFRLRDGEPLKIYSLEELLARVRDGGRSDVELRASGDVMHGAWDEAQGRIKRAGLAVLLAAPSSGLLVRAGVAWRDDTRGQYR